MSYDEIMEQIKSGLNERGNKEAAKYCFEIIYDLVGGDELKKLIDELSE